MPNQPNPQDLETTPFRHDSPSPVDGSDSKPSELPLPQEDWIASPSPSQPPLHWEPPLPHELNGRIPGFHVIDVLGRGGMGAVYKAVQISLDRTVAIKILVPALGSDPQFEARFQREAKSMARLNHPNIVQVYDFGHAVGDLRYIVMEYVEGTDLRRLIRGGALPTEGVLHQVMEICDALQYAHDRGLVHRDLKPSNIFIDRDGHIKIGDFGLAKLGEDLSASGGAAAGADLTLSGISMGTPYYMAPEQQEALRFADRRSDIFSLGVILYEMITGTLPRGAAKAPSHCRPEVDPRLDSIIFQAIDPDPEARFSSARAFKTEIGRVSDPVTSVPAPHARSTARGSANPSPGFSERPRKSSPAKSGSPSQGAGEAVASKAAKSAAAESPRKRQSSRRLFATIAALAILVSGGAFLSHRWQSPVGKAGPQSDGASSQDGTDASRTGSLEDETHLPGSNGPTRSPADLLAQSISLPAGKRKADLLEQAITLFEENGDDKRRIMALYQLAEMWSRAGDWPKAVEVHERLIALGEFKSYWTLAEVFRTAGIMPKSLENYRNYAATVAESDILTAEDELAEVGAVIGLLELADRWKKEGEDPDHRRVLQRALEVLQSGKELDNSSRESLEAEIEAKLGESYLKEGDRLVERKQWDAAKQAYTQAGQYASMQAAWRLGRLDRLQLEDRNIPPNPIILEERTGLYDPAWAGRERLKNDPKAVAEMVEYARVLNDTTNPLRDETKAIEIYRWAADNDKSGQAAYLLGIYHHNRREYPFAVTWYEKATDIGFKAADLPVLLKEAKEGRGGKTVE